jgi:hypothetical protein
MVLDMGKIPYCGKETRVMTTYIRWTPERLGEVRRLMASGMSVERAAEALGLKKGTVEMALLRHKPERAESASA